MTKKLNISPEDMIQTPVCKNPEEAISKEAFLKWFELCVKQFKWLNQAYFSGIIKRAQTDYSIITIEEYSDLVKLLEDKEFLDIANQVFYKAVAFSRTAEEGLGNINPVSLKNNLILHVYKRVVKDATGEVLLEERWVSWLLLTFEDITIFSKHGRYFIKYLQTWEIKEFSDILVKPEIREVWLIWVEVKWKWWILLNEKWEQVSPDGEFYLKIDLERIKNLWLIWVEQNRDSWKFLDKTGKQVTPEWVYYERFDVSDFEGMTLIRAKVKWKWWILLDEWRRQISKENTFYKGFSLTEIWLIEAIADNTGWMVYIDKNGWQVTPVGEVYENLNIRRWKDITLIQAKVKWKWWILLNEKWGQISPEWEYYENINLNKLEEFWLIGVTIWEGKHLFDVNWKQISPPEDRIYDWFDLWRYEEFWLIVGEIRLVTRDIRFHGWILFDKTGKRISPEWEYFNSFDVGNLKEFWLIEWISRENWRVLFDWDWERISPKWEIYEFFNLSYLKKDWIIKTEIRWKWAVLLNKNWEQITPKWEYYEWINFEAIDYNDIRDTWLGIAKIQWGLGAGEIKWMYCLFDKTWKKHFSSEKSIKFDDETKKFYTEWLFRKKYIEVNLDSKN